MQCHITPLYLASSLQCPTKFFQKSNTYVCIYTLTKCSRFGSYGLMEFGTFSNQQLRIMDIFELAYTTRLFATVFKWHIVHLKPRIFSVYKKVNNFVKKKHTTLETTSSTPQHHYVISLQCLIHIYLHSGLAAKGAQLEFPPSPGLSSTNSYNVVISHTKCIFIPCAL